MTFLQRLKYYGIGLVLGLLVVYAMFGNRTCSSPNEIKMYELARQHFIFSDKASCKMKCLRKNTELLKIELRHFEINYDLSSPRNKPCGAYFVLPKPEHKSEYQYQMILNDCDTITRIDDIQITGTLNCNCP
ncbi:MAG TPA: hypothetical protein PLQ93_13520 [Bacteroidia bacterium]|nr:hypothetical protein [Bacteroidia bacterium]